ncbi:MAG: type II secretion system F family protein [Actinomycetota bacterium]
MSGIIAGLAALGLLLLYDGLTSPPGARPPGVSRRVDRLAREAGLARASGATILLVMSAGSLISFVLVTGITRSAVVGTAFASLAAFLPISTLRARALRRRRRFRDAWPDAIGTLISAVRSGTSLGEACVSLSERGPDDLRPGFQAFGSTYRATGSLAASLDRLRERLADPIADRVVAALLIAHEVGGTDLVRVLRALGDFVREDGRVRKEIEARWSWTVTAARVASAAPWIVLLLMATRAEAARAYSSPEGALIIATGAAITLLGYRLMLRAGRLPEERRLD